jgi:hypothetical protein
VAVPAHARNSVLGKPKGRRRVTTIKKSAHLMALKPLRRRGATLRVIKMNRWPRRLDPWYSRPTKEMRLGRVRHPPGVPDPP